MRVLGVDPGEKRIGLAVTDALGITAQGISTIYYDHIDQAFIEIKKVCHNYEVEKLVVGNPVNMDGSRGEASKRAEMLADSLRNYLGLPVLMVDERLTSKIAENILIDGGLSREKRRYKKDKMAAALILETYLALHGKK